MPDVFKDAYPSTSWNLLETPLFILSRVPLHPCGFFGKEGHFSFFNVTEL